MKVFRTEREDFNTFLSDFETTQSQSVKQPIFFQLTAVFSWMDQIPRAESFLNEYVS